MSSKVVIREVGVNFESPMSDVIPSAHGAVLNVLARTSKALTGRAVAALTDGRVGQSRTNQVLAQLVEAGIATRDVQGAAHLYLFNRDHVAAAGILQLLGMREEFIARLTVEVTSWAVPAEAVWMFGSAAQGVANAASDVDLCIVRAAAIDADDDEWQAQVDGLVDRAHAWCGNDVRVVEFDRAELRAWGDRGEPLVDSLRSEVVHIFGAEVDVVLAH